MRRSALAILAPTAIHWLCLAAAADPSPIWPPELSGAARLPDGTLVLVDDETPGAIFFWDGDPTHPPMRRVLGLAMDDLEGAAADSSGAIYLLTSHSQTRRGRARRERERLACLLPEPSPGLKLVEDFTRVFLDHFGADRRQLNLEGLAWYPPRDALLIGARSPLRQGRAQVLVVGPAARLFDAARPHGSGAGGLDLELKTLDLGGRGIRSLSYDPWRRRLWVLAGSVRGESAERSDHALFLWGFESGNIEAVVAPGLERITQPEGVEPLGEPDPATRETAILVAGEGASPIRLAARPVELP